MKALQIKVLLHFKCENSSVFFVLMDPSGFLCSGDRKLWDQSMIGPAAEGQKMVNKSLYSLSEVQ